MLQVPFVLKGCKKHTTLPGKSELSVSLKFSRFIPVNYGNLHCSETVHRGSSRRFLYLPSCSGVQAQAAVVDSPHGLGKLGHGVVGVGVQLLHEKCVGQAAVGGVLPQGGLPAACALAHQRKAGG